MATIKYPSCFIHVKVLASSVCLGSRDCCGPLADFGGVASEPPGPGARPFIFLISKPRPLLRTRESSGLSHVFSGVLLAFPQSRNDE